MKETKLHWYHDTAFFNGAVFGLFQFSNLRVSSVVEHSSAYPKVPGSIPGPVSYRGHGL